MLDAHPARAPQPRLRARARAPRRDPGRRGRAATPRTRRPARAHGSLPRAAPGLQDPARVPASSLRCPRLRPASSRAATCATSDRLARGALPPGRRRADRREHRLVAALLRRHVHRSLRVARHRARLEGRVVDGEEERAVQVAEHVLGRHRVAGPRYDSPRSAFRSAPPRTPSRRTASARAARASGRSSGSRARTTRRRRRRSRAGARGSPSRPRSPWSSAAGPGSRRAAAAPGIGSGAGGSGVLHAAASSASASAVGPRHARGASGLLDPQQQQRHRREHERQRDPTPVVVRSRAAAAASRARARRTTGSW